MKLTLSKNFFIRSFMCGLSLGMLLFTSIVPMHLSTKSNVLSMRSFIPQKNFHSMSDNMLANAMYLKACEKGNRIERMNLLKKYAAENVSIISQRTTSRGEITGELLNIAVKQKGTLLPRQDTALFFADIKENVFNEIQSMCVDDVRFSPLNPDLLVWAIAKELQKKGYNSITMRSAWLPYMVKGSVLKDLYDRSKIVSIDECGDVMRSYSFDILKSDIE